MYLNKSHYISDISKFTTMGLYVTIYFFLHFPKESLTSKFFGEELVKTKLSIKNQNKLFS